MAKKKLTSKKQATSSDTDRKKILKPYSPAKFKEDTTDTTFGNPMLRKFPPPKNGVVFKQKWAEFLPSIVMRENFKANHLSQLAMLCDLFEEYDVLNEFLRKNGYTYISIGRNGKVFKNYPQAITLERVRASIAQYLKVLNVLPGKDVSTASGTEEEEWA